VCVKEKIGVVASWHTATYMYLNIQCSPGCRVAYVTDVTKKCGESTGLGLGRSASELLMDNHPRCSEVMCPFRETQHLELAYDMSRIQTP